MWSLMRIPSIETGSNQQKDNAVVQQLDKFRDLVKDLHQSDDILKCFLKARQGDLPKSEDMLRKMVQWRKDKAVSFYKNWDPPSILANDFRFDFLGLDNDGYAVIFVPAGRWHLIEMFDAGMKEAMHQFRYYLLESIMSFLERSRQRQFVMIIDIFEGSYKTTVHYESVQMIMAAFRDFEANYPERLRTGFIIRAPWAFSILYSCIKPLLSAETVSKVHIFGCDNSKWMPVLRKTIPEDVLAKMY